MQKLAIVMGATNKTLTVAAICLDCDCRIVMRSSNRVPPADGSASVGMSSIFCASAHVA